MDERRFREIEAFMQSAWNLEDVAFSALMDEHEITTRDLGEYMIECRRREVGR